MWILTSIFQAIGQALSWIFPISESGHSAIFHDFSTRYTNTCSQLTGVIHIGIAIGIFLASLGFFIKLFKGFFGCWIDVFNKRLDIKHPTPIKQFIYMTILSFVPMVLYPIPAGKFKNIYMVFHSFSFNKTVIDEGICILLMGVLLMFTLSRVNKVNSLPPILQSVLIGVAVFFAVPTAGCSLVAAVFCVGVLSGLNQKIALKYSYVMSVMVLIVMGIIEICIGATKVSIVGAIIALVVSIAVSFLLVRVLTYLLKKRLGNYIAWYDIVLGALCTIIGIFEIIVKFRG